jgi:uncharacterized membrane protein
MKSLLATIILTSFSTFSVIYAQLTFVNSTTETVYLSIMQYTKGEWIASGWFEIEPLATRVFVRERSNRYYYYYAQSSKKTWSGNDASAWIHEKDAFKTVEGVTYKRELGYKLVGFQLIDLEDKKSYTVTLDLRTDFEKQIELYFKKNKNLDPLEGLYTISDNINVEYQGFFSSSKKSVKKDHWAKVAILEDTVSLSRNYYEVVLEASGFRQGEVRADFLKINQNSNLFISDQINSSKDSPKSVSFEFDSVDGILRGEFSYRDNDAVYKVNRTYLKYFPKDK